MVACQSPTEPTEEETVRGKILATEAGYTLVFTRELTASVECVWQMLTDRAARAEWLFDGTIEAGVGGLVDLYDSHHTISGRVTAWQPPHLLALTWSSPDAPHGEVRFELTETANATCRLRVAHTADREARPRSLAAGWHAMLDHLLVFLDLAPADTHPTFDDLVRDYHDAPIERPERT